MANFGIRLLGLFSGQPTPFDGQWLAEYDPLRPGVTPDGQPLTAHIVCSDDPAQAMRFSGYAAAHTTWTAGSGRTRPDGKPDRPLTAFHMVVEELPAGPPGKV